MTERRNGKNRREEYRRIRINQTKSIKSQPEKSISSKVGEPRRSKRIRTIQKRRMVGLTRQERRKIEAKKAQRSAIKGIFLMVLLIFATMFFMGALFWLDMLTTKNLIIIGSCLLFAITVMFITQMSSKVIRAGGKVFGVALTFVLVIVSFFIIKTNGLLEVVTDSKHKTDNIVVAVLVDNPANQIYDAKDYKFGIQHKSDAQNTDTTLKKIQQELDDSVTIRELSDLTDQVRALHDGEVDAIIFNEGYTEVLKEAIEGFGDDVKIIYEHKVKTELQNLAIDVEEVVAQQEPFNVYISGIDVYGDVSQTSNSDVNIIATVNPKTHQILLITTPRDYYVEIPNISYGLPDKLTHAGIYGVDASMATMEELYDTKIPFYGRMNFTSLIGIIDILGGVDVDSPIAFETGQDSGYVMEVQEGKNHFDGKQALAFSRERKQHPDGEPGRGENQLRVITAILEKMLSPTMLLKAGEIFDNVAGSVETNISSDQIRDLIKQQQKEKAQWQIFSVAAEGIGDRDVCFSADEATYYVSRPIEESVKEIQDLIDLVEAGELIEGSTILN